MPADPFGRGKGLGYRRTFASGGGRAGLREGVGSVPAVEARLERGEKKSAREGREFSLAAETGGRRLLGT